MSDQRESNPHFHLGKVTLGHSTMIAHAETPHYTGYQHIPFAFENTTGITTSRLISNIFLTKKLQNAVRRVYLQRNPTGRRMSFASYQRGIVSVFPA